MWFLTMRSPLGEPREYVVRAGKMMIGRKSDNDIFVPDPSASRFHAEIQLDPESDTLTIRDNGSTNGTFVNRERIATPHPLKADDQIRIGEHVITVGFRDTEADSDTLPGTQPFTRDLLLEALDQHTVLLYEVAARLNTVTELDAALREVANLVKLSMGADKCEVILAEQLGGLPQASYAAIVARQAIEQRAAVLVPDTATQPDPAHVKSAQQQNVRSALCVPVMSADDVLALLYVYKTRALSHPFDQRDLQLAIAIGHQASLTIQRTRLLERLQQEQRDRLILQRFLSPRETESILPDYLKTGHLPEMAERTLTVLFADIRGATRLAERLGPRRFGSLLNRFFSEMMQAVFEHDGLLCNFIGDGLLAVFGMFGQSEPEVRAVAAAQAMLARLAAVNQAENEAIELGIGLNTGPLWAGYLDMKDRFEFSVLGETVNIAQMLEQRATKNAVLVGPATAAALAGRFKVEPREALEIKGRAEPVPVHEVVRG